MLTINDARAVQRLLDEAVPTMQARVMQNPNFWDQAAAVIQLEAGRELLKRLLAEAGTPV